MDQVKAMAPKVEFAITGMGAVTPAGVGIEPLQDALVRPRSFTRRIERFETADLPSDLGAVIDDFDPRDHLSRNEIAWLDRSAQLLVAAGDMALAQSAILRRGVDGERIGIFEASSVGGIDEALQAHDRFMDRGYKALSPRTLSRAMTGAGGAMLSLRHGIQGPALAMSCGSASSAAVLSVALDQLAAGTIDAALVAAAEAPVTRSVLALFGRARVLSRRRDGAAGACRPFDAQRDGIVLGEGAAALVIERAADARRPLAQVAGVAMTGDANALFAPADDGAQQARAIQMAMLRAGVIAREIDYVSAHGTGTRLNDRVETLALKRALGADAYRVPVSSSKSMLGHCLGACSAVEIVKTVLCMRRGVIPATLNLEYPDPDCDLDYVPGRPRPAAIDVALVNSSSFGGRNVCTVLRAAHPRSAIARAAITRTRPAHEFEARPGYQPAA